MDIIIREIPDPMFTESQLFAELDIVKLKEKCVVQIIAQHHTKTRVHTSFKFGLFLMGVNWNIKGFNTFHTVNYNMFSHEREEAHFFVSSKHQTKEDYRSYITDIVRKLLESYNLQSLKIEFIDRFKTWK